MTRFEDVMEKREQCVIICEECKRSSQGMFRWTCPRCGSEKIEIENVPGEGECDD